MYKLTGLPDIAIGSWEYYKARKALNEGKLTEETSLTRKRQYRAKIGIGALKISMMGVMAHEILYPMVTNFNNYNFNTNEIGIMAAFAAGYAVLGMSIGYASIFNDEASNYKYKQSDLENKFKLKLTSSKNNEINSGETYQLFMFGNKIATGNPVDNFLFKIKNKVLEWKSNFNVEQKEEYNIIKNSIYNFLNNIGITNFISNIASKAKMKKEAYDIIKINADINSKENEEFKKYIKNKKPEISLNDDDIKKELKSINQEAIINTYQKVLIQNLQLFFAEVLSDYNKGIVHKNLIEDFSKLAKDNTIKKDRTILIEEYEKISKLASKMLKNENLQNNFKKPMDTLIYLNGKNIDKNGKFKIIRFNETFSLEKKSILNEKNGTIKTNANIYEDRKAKFTELSQFDDLSKFVSIKNNNNSIKEIKKQKI